MVGNATAAARVYIPGAVAAARGRPGGSGTNCGAGAQRQWHSRYGAGTAHLDQHGAGAPEKKSGGGLVPGGR